MNSNFLIIDSLVPSGTVRDAKLPVSAQGAKKIFSVPLNDESARGVNVSYDTILDSREKQTEKTLKDGKLAKLPATERYRTEQGKSYEDATLLSQSQNCETDIVAGAKNDATNDTVIPSNQSETSLSQDDICGSTGPNGKTSVESPDESQQLIQTVLAFPAILTPVTLQSPTNAANPDLNTITQIVEQNILSSAEHINQISKLLAEGQSSKFQSLTNEALIDSQNNMQMEAEQVASDTNFQPVQTQDLKNGIENALIELLQSSSLTEKESLGKNGVFLDKIKNIASGIKDIRANQSEINTVQYINRESGINAQFELQKSLLEQITSAVKDTGTTSQPVNDLTGSFTSDIGRQIFDSIQSSLTGQGISNNITVRMNPPELGHVVIKLQDKATHITGILEVSNIQTKTAVEQALPQLVKNLADSGIEIKRLEVVLSNNTQSQSHAQKENLFSGEHQQQNLYDDSYTSSIIKDTDDANRQNISIGPVENNSMKNSALAGDYLNILL